MLYLILIKYINSNTIVQLIINGIGKQKILSNNFEKPQEIYVNWEIQDNREYYNLTESETNITMKWYNELTNLSNMVSNLNNITKIDFLNINLSTIDISTICGISTLISLNLNNFVIISGSSNDIIDIFPGFTSLLSLNLNNFSITSEFDNHLQYMFLGCSSLISLNLNNFSITGVN